ncbi:hypothetical protein BDF20DRAFT_895632 [Mycotypha africana]|uniref:uncharacterized protein n=1 Tax=Mycotypha africana TaxID=64632 RepID=UPI0023014238|nr:uncharacterized protein BDF20DRAFT_895632 [Mycotypha africana]KAI8968320.1 hypothetical protein BDF20DRAFT_895632 [Mycotypha africana]
MCLRHYVITGHEILSSKKNYLTVMNSVPFLQNEEKKNHRPSIFNDVPADDRALFQPMKYRVNIYIRYLQYFLAVLFIIFSDYRKR